MPFGIQGITASGLIITIRSGGITESPMPFGIQGITADIVEMKTPEFGEVSLQCLSAFRASLPQARESKS